MALTVKQLIKKLEAVKNKDKDIFFETPYSFLSVDLVFIDEDNELILSNNAESEHCDCEYCNEHVKEI